MPLFLKRSLLMLGGALLVLVSLKNLATTVIDPASLPMPPANKGERSGMILSGIALVVLGGYLFVLGKRIQIPK